MNIQTMSPLSTAHDVSDEELVELLADDVADDYVERLFDATAEEMDALNGADLQSLSSDGMTSGPAAELVDAIAEDVAERGLDANLDKVIDARVAAPPSSISALALQSSDPVELYGLFRKIGRGLRRIGSVAKKALRGPLKGILKEVGKRAIPAIIGLFQAAVPQGIDPQGLFRRIRNRVSGLIRKGKKKVKDFVRGRARDFVRSALDRVDGFLQDRINRFSADVPGMAGPSGAESENGSDDGFFWEEDPAPAAFSATVPMASPARGGPQPLFI